MSVEALTAENFDSTITDNGIVVIDFWAPWCGPCVGFAPVFDKAASENADIKFVKVNTDEEQELAGHFGIRSIPTLLVFRDQVIVFQQPGAMSKGALEDVLRQIRELDMEEVRRGAVPYASDEEPTAKTVQ